MKPTSSLDTITSRKVPRSPWRTSMSQKGKKRTMVLHAEKTGPIRLQVRITRKFPRKPNHPGKCMHACTQTICTHAHTQAAHKGTDLDGLADLTAGGLSERDHCAGGGHVVGAQGQEQLWGAFYMGSDGAISTPAGQWYWIRGRRQTHMFYSLQSKTAGTAQGLSCAFCCGQRGTGA